MRFSLKIGAIDMENSEKNYISIDEAAKLLRVHRTTLHSWIRRDVKEKKETNESEWEKLKKIKCPPYSRIGARFWFRKEDIEKFIKDSMNQ